MDSLDSTSPQMKIVHDIYIYIYIYIYIWSIEEWLSRVTSYFKFYLGHFLFTAININKLSRILYDVLILVVYFVGGE